MEVAMATGPIKKVVSDPAFGFATAQDDNFFQVGGPSDWTLQVRASTGRMR
jgi:hypothetical protein